MWVLDIGSSNHRSRAWPPDSSFARAHIAAARSLPARRRAMQSRDANTDDAVKEIATLLAKAYQRRAQLRLVHAPSPEIASTEELAYPAETSVHELTLTGRRKESPGS